MADEEPRPQQVVLRIKLRYEDVDTMVQRFAPNVGRSGLFIPTKSIQPLGTEVKFELRLGNDVPVLVGLGRVRGAREPDPSRPKAAFGMAVELLRVTRDSRVLILRMLERRKALGLPDLAIPMPEDIDAARSPGDGTAARIDISAPVVRVEAVVTGSGPHFDSAVIAPIAPAPADTAPGEPLLTAPRRSTGPIGVARVEPSPFAGLEALPPEPPRRTRPRMQEVMEQASVELPAMPDLEDAVDIEQAVLRARALAAVAGDLDAELDALGMGDATPEVPAAMDIEAASAELAMQLGGVAVARRERSSGWAMPPAVVPVSEPEPDPVSEREGRTPDAGHRMPEAEDRTPDAGRRMPDADDRTPYAEVGMPEADDRTPYATAPTPPLSPPPSLPAALPELAPPEPDLATLTPPTAPPARDTPRASVVEDAAALIEAEAAAAEPPDRDSAALIVDRRPVAEPPVVDGGFDTPASGFALPDDDGAANPALLIHDHADASQFGAPHVADDDVQELDESDMQDVEHTVIGEMPMAPDAYETEPAMVADLAERLDAHLAEAEAEADAELVMDAGVGIREDTPLPQPAEAIALPPADTVDSDDPAPASDDDDDVEPVDDFEILAEADADDADLLLSDGEADASADHAPAYREPARERVPQPEPEPPPLLPRAAASHARKSRRFSSPAFDYGRLDLGDDSSAHEPAPGVSYDLERALDADSDRPSNFTIEAAPAPPGDDDMDFDEPHAGFDPSSFDDDPWKSPAGDSAAVRPALPEHERKQREEPGRSPRTPRAESRPGKLDLESALDELDVSDPRRAPRAVSDGGVLIDFDDEDET